MMKQNTNVMYELFYTICTIIALVAIAFIINNTSLYLAIMMISLYIVNMMTTIIVEMNKSRLFEKIY